MPFPISSSLLDAIVLAIVSREDTYGYRITQDVRQVMEISESTLYPVLRRLLKDGCLTTHDHAVDGRIRRYYAITPLGRMRLSEALRDWANYRDSIEKVFFGGYQHE
ncbi:MAG: PadR family transcriptional regulator [Butyricicoccus pullicaecorum]|nr:PadR family transcriptional regulator [Butyricicoccus pullicaecorum]